MDSPQDFYIRLTNRSGDWAGGIQLTLDSEALVPPANACGVVFDGDPTIALLVGPDAETVQTPAPDFLYRQGFIVWGARCELDFPITQGDALEANSVHTIWVRRGLFAWLDQDGHHIEPQEGSNPDYRAEPAMARSRNALEHLARALGPGGEGALGGVLFQLGSDALTDLQAALVDIARDRDVEKLGPLAPSVAQLDAQAAAAVEHALAQMENCRARAQETPPALAFGACSLAGSSLDLAERSLGLANQLSEDGIFTPPGSGGGLGHVIQPR